jgi:hypothetical protein
MLIASSSAIVGVMKSQATARSDRPRTRRAIVAGVAAIMRAVKDVFAAIPLIGWSLQLL